MRSSTKPLRAARRRASAFRCHAPGPRPLGPLHGRQEPLQLVQEQGVGMEAPAVPLRPGRDLPFGHPLQAYPALDGRLQVHRPHLGWQGLQAAREALRERGHGLGRPSSQGGFQQRQERRQGRVRGFVPVLLGRQGMDGDAPRATRKAMRPP